ncbi:MAG TPA: Wzz/FepE/Etk N-terminal domain-containing protein [Gemmatimonadales bacterium]|nr:Wzz/FepE/Etk N-terminal domain-containing protein [Gemmatimonadales bacterium]
MTAERRTIFPLLEALARRYRLVLGVPFVAAILTSIAVLVMPPSYASTASFVPENPVQPRLPSNLAGLATQFGVNLGAEGSRSPAFYADVLRSRQILSEVLGANVSDPRAGDSMTVSTLYRVKGATPEQRLDDGVKALRNRITVGVDQRTNVVRVTVEAPSAVAARDVLQLLLDRLADFNVHTRQSTAGERRKFIEGRTASAEQDLHGAEQALRAFYERNRQWQSSPQLRLEEQELNRQVTIQQELYLTLRREYETARIEEVNNTPVLTIIDHPTVPGRRARPQRTVTVLLVTLVVGMLATVLAILLQDRDDLLASGDPEYLRFHRRVTQLFRREPSVAK